MSKDTLQRYQNEFTEAFGSPGTNGSVRSGLSALRHGAMRQFVGRGFPTTRDESWRFTDLSKMSRKHFEHIEETEPAPLDRSAIADHLLEDGTVHQLVFVDGRFREDLSRIEEIPEGVTLSTLRTEIGLDTKRLRSHLGQIVDLEKSVFTALNTAMMRDGIFMHLPRGTVIETPVHVLFVTSEHKKRVASYPRNLILVEPDCQIQFIETYVGFGEEPYLTNAVTEIELGDHSVFEHYKVQRESPKAYHFATVQTRQARSSTFASHSIAIGARLARTHVNTTLADEGCSTTLNGLYLVDGKRLIDNQTSIDHAKPHGTSQELYKGILKDRSRAVFNGEIIVQPDAAKSDANQQNKNLILSDETTIDTKPQLEIFNNDVKCAHGAAVGQLDAESMFYLRSRGIDSETASRMLQYAFASEVIESVRVRPLREKLDALLSEDLPEPLITRELETV